MQAINNNSYSSQGVQPISAYGQTNQISMPKPPMANQMVQNSYATPPVAQQNAQAQPTQAQPQQTQVMPVYPQGVNIPAGGAVNINIFNPTTTNGAPIYPQNTYYTSPAATYPAYVPQGNMMLPQMPAPQNAYPAIQTQQTNVQMPAPQQLQTQDTQALNQSPQANETQGPAPEQKTEEKPVNITPLTDEYIKTLENYLNDNDPKVRLMGATQLLEKFKEHESRKSDPALTALLNKSLKDPSASVRQMALTTLNIGYASGNEETIALLNDIQANTQGGIYAEDALSAKEILLKLSQQGQNIVPSQNAGTVQV